MDFGLTLRKVTAMFERFTDQSRRITVLAQQEAHPYGRVGTEHLLLGLLHDSVDSVARRALNNTGITFASAKAKLIELYGEGGEPLSSHTPFTVRNKKVLELSIREALQLGNNYIGTEHLLLSMTRDGEGKGIEIIRALGVDPGEVRRATIQLLLSERRVAIEPGTKTRNREDILAEIGMHEVAIERLKAELEEHDKNS